MWRVYRWRAQFLTALLTLLIVSTITAIAALAVVDLSMDMTDRALRAFMASAVLWVCAIFVGRDICVSRDAALGPITPLSLRRYYFRNFCLDWPVHFAGIVLGPILLWFWVGAAYEGDGTPVIIDAHTGLNALLLYYAILLGPLAENFAGIKAGAFWIFVPRYVFRRYLKAAIAAVVAGFLLNNFTNGAIHEYLRGAIERLFESGDLGLIGLTLLSPASTLAIEHQLASPTFEVGFTAALTLTLAAEIAAIVRGVLQRDSQVERAGFEFWVEQRQAYSEAVDAAVKEEDENLIEWSESRLTFDRDMEQSRPDLPYRDDLPAEVQVIRHIDYFPKSDDGAKLHVKMLRHVGHALFLTFVFLCWLLWFALESRTAKAIWIPNVVLVFALVRNYFVGVRWEDSIKICLGVPLRMSRLVARAIPWKLSYDIAVDVAVVVFFVTSRNVSPWFAASLFMTLQIMRVSSHLGTWLESIAHAGPKLPHSFWNWTGFLFWMIGTIVFLRLDAQRQVNVLNQSWLQALLPSFAVVSLSQAALLIFWLHRKTDYSILVFRSSYSETESDSDS